MTKKNRTRADIALGIAFSVAALVALTGTVLVSGDRDWMAIGRGLALTGVFVTVALRNLVLDEEHEKAADGVTLGLAAVYLLLLVAGLR